MYRNAHVQQIFMHREKSKNQAESPTFAIRYLDYITRVNNVFYDFCDCFEDLLFLVELFCGVRNLVFLRRFKQNPTAVTTNHLAQSSSQVET